MRNPSKYLCLVAPLLSPASNAVDIELGTYVSQIKYTEPGVMKQTGWMSGLTGKATWNFDDNFLTLDGLIASGLIDYSSPSSGSIDNIEDKIYEIRVLAGKKLNLNFDNKYSVAFEPYMGFGFRRLQDDMSLALTSDLSVGYKRQQDYTYIPVGVSFEIPTQSNAWSAKANLEYNYFLDGTNKSWIKDGADYYGLSGYPNLTLGQDSGKGYRASIKLTKNGLLGFNSVSIEPFYKYWDIEASEIVNGYIEPKNDSKEIGLNISANFDDSFSTSNSNSTYIIAGSHQSKTKADTQFISDLGFSVDKNDLAEDIGLGFELTDQFAIEISYLNYGKLIDVSTGSIATSSSGNDVLGGTYLAWSANASGSADLEIDASALTLSAVAKQPVSDKISLTGILGVSEWESEAKLTGTLSSGSLIIQNQILTTGSESITVKRNGTAPFYGIGVTYDLNNKISIRGDITRHALWFHDIDLYSLKALYRF